GGIELRGALSDLPLNETKLSDGLAEGFPLLCIFDSLCERMPRAANAGHTQLEPSNVEHVECDVVAFARFPEQIASGDFTVLQHERARGRTANSQLVLLGTDGQARRIALNQERGK